MKQVFAILFTIFVHNVWAQGVAQTYFFENQISNQTAIANDPITNDCIVYAYIKDSLVYQHHKWYGSTDTTHNAKFALLRLGANGDLLDSSIFEYTTQRPHSGHSGGLLNLFFFALTINENGSILLREPFPIVSLTINGDTIFQNNLLDNMLILCLDANFNLKWIKGVSQQSIVLPSLTNQDLSYPDSSFFVEDYRNLDSLTPLPSKFDSIRQLPDFSINYSIFVVFDFRGKFISAFAARNLKLNVNAYRLLTKVIGNKVIMQFPNFFNTQGFTIFTHDSVVVFNVTNFRESIHTIGLSLNDGKIEIDFTTTFGINGYSNYPDKTIYEDGFLQIVRSYDNITPIEISGMGVNYTLPPFVSNSALSQEVFIHFNHQGTIERVSNNIAFYNSSPISRYAIIKDGSKVCVNSPIASLPQIYFFKDQNGGVVRYQNPNHNLLFLLDKDDRLVHYREITLAENWRRSFLPYDYKNHNLTIYGHIQSYADLSLNPYETTPYTTTKPGFLVVRYQYFPVSTTNLSAQPITAKLYPNPSRGMFVLEDLPSNAQIIIYNLQGQAVQQVSNHHQERLSINHNLLAGLYFVSINHPKGRQTLKLVIN